MAHAGLDAANGISAVDELFDQLQDLRMALPTAMSAACNVGRIEGGTRVNIFAGGAHAEIGLRFATKATEEALFEALHSLRAHRAGAVVDVKVMSHRPAWPPSQPSWLVEHVKALATSLGNTSRAAPAGCAGDTNSTGALGIATLDRLEPRGSHAHAKGECVSISSLLHRAELLAALMSQPLSG